MQEHLRTAPRSTILIVVKDIDATSIKRKVGASCGLGWEDQVKFKVVPRDVSRDELTDYVIDLNHESAFYKVYFQTGLLNCDVLDEERVDFTCRPSSAALYREAKNSLFDLGIHWEKRAFAEWSKSSLGCMSPKEWHAQFSKLDHGDTARNILKSLRVITDADVRAAFIVNNTDGIGRREAHAYFHDNEPGSSSIAVKNVLEHMHPEGEVTALDLADRNYFEGLDADVLYVYEDGLWSGVEVVKRIQSLAEIQALSQSRTQVVFKYCVTCDAGLAAARLACARHPVGRFEIRSAAQAFHFSFIRPNVDLSFPELRDRSDDAVRIAIDDKIEPYLFGLKDLWGSERGDALQICADIGEQLVRPYLQRKAREKAKLLAVSKGGDADVAQANVTVSQQDIDRWKLGAMEFASTIVFASSIPKPVLPLMWLKGPVTVNGVTVDWKPLFWDARRIGESAQ
ncbi:phosphoribosyltransferase-like protein [Pseudomonas syringae]